MVAYQCSVLMQNLDNVIIQVESNVNVKINSNLIVMFSTKDEIFLCDFLNMQVKKKHLGF